MNDNEVARRAPELDETSASAAHEMMLAQLPGAQPTQLIAPDGTLADPERAGGLDLPDDDTLLHAYRRMVIARRWDTQVTKLTRQGRLATFPSGLGQEASEIGSVLALEEHDWMFPTYRDSLALLTRGIEPGELLPFFRGDWHVAYNPYDHNVSNQATPLATQTLHAVGFAHAERMRGRDTVALTYLGDGAASEGDAFEALNFAATWQTPTVFFVQNNQYAISVPIEQQTRSRSIADRAAGLGMPGEWVDGNDVAAVLAVVGEAVARARRGEGPTLIEARTYRLEAHTNSDDPGRYRTADEQAAWEKFCPISRLAIYLRDRGVLTDEIETELTAEAEALAAATRDVMNDEPELNPLELFDHVYAEPRAALQEQRRALAAEMVEREDLSDQLRDAARAALDDQPAPPTATVDASETAPGPAETMTMAGALNAALADSLTADDSVVVYGEDVGALGGVFRVTDKLAAELGPERVWDSPLAESGIVGTAIGMAMAGMRPVVEMQFDAFSYPSFEQVVSHAAKMRNRTRGNVALPMVIRIPTAGAIGGVEHHSDSSEAYWAATPGLTVMQPATPQDAYTMLRQAIASPDPVIFMEPKSRYWMRGEVRRDGSAHGAKVVREGTDVTLIAYGATVRTALAAAESGAAEGLSIEVIDLRTLSPFDDDTVAASVKKTSRAAVIHEAAQFGGYGAEVAARVSERCFYWLDAPVLRITGFDVPYPSPKLEEFYLPTAERVLAALDTWEW